MGWFLSRKAMDAAVERCDAAVAEYALRIDEWRKHDLDVLDGCGKRLLCMADEIDSLRAMVMRYENRILQLEARLPVDDADDEWLDAEHACLHLGIGRSTLAKLRLPKRTGGRKHYWSRKVLDAWAAKAGR